MQCLHYRQRLELRAKWVCKKGTPAALKIIQKTNAVRWSKGDMRDRQDRQCHTESESKVDFIETRMAEF